MVSIRKQVINLATEIALQESAKGKDYKECINKALNEACSRLGVNKKEFIKMFI